MRFSDDFLAELRSRVDIEELIGRYTEVRHRGSRNPTCLCPFHTEKTPSFTIYPETWSYYCFGCGSGGDAIRFVRNIENLDYTEAVRFLCEKAGMAMPTDSVDDEGTRLRRRCFEANREAARFFCSALTKDAGKPARDYLEKRRLSPGIIKSFGLGYAPDTWDALTKYLRNKGFSEAELLSFDLSKRNRSGSLRDTFRNRLMIPIIDLRGNVVAFGGRVLDETKPKYINTSDTVVYKKGQGIYALNFAKNNKDRKLILCEGYMDVISMHEAGFPNAVAALGTAFTTEQVNLLARYCDEIYLSFDSDEAGQRATARAIRMLENSPMKVRILELSGGKDPDEIIKTEGRGAMQKFLSEAPNETEFRLKQTQKKYDVSTEDGKVSFLKAAAEILAGVRSPVERDVYLTKVAKLTDSSAEALAREVRIAGTRMKKREDSDAFASDARRASGDDMNIPNPERRGHLRAAKAEETILASLLLNPDYLKRFSSLLSADDFVTKANREIFEGFRYRIENQKSLDLTSFGEEASKELMSLLAYLWDRSKKIAGTPEEFEDCIKTLLREKQKQTVSDVKNISDEDFLRILQEKRKNRDQNP